MKPNVAALGIIAVLHAVGVLGVISGYGAWIWPLTPLNLLVAGGLAIWRAWPARTGWWLVVALSGYVAEVIGVQQGWLFGSYAYGTALGPVVAGVPLMLGWMWLLLLQGSRYRWGGRWGQAVLGATLMTGMDGLIEPVAIRAGWWSWSAVQSPWMSWISWDVAGQSIPWWNFGSWWVVSFVLLLFAPAVPSLEHQRVWRGLWWVMVSFFTLLNVFEWS